MADGRRSAAGWRVVRLFVATACAVVSMALVPKVAMAADLADLGTFTNPTATSLGSVNKYAAFAETYHKLNHMEGTIAADYLDTGSDAFGVTDNVVGYVDPDEAFVYFAHITSGLANITSTNSANGSRPWHVIMPDDVTIDRSANNGNGARSRTRRVALRSPRRSTTSPTSGRPSTG